MRPIMEQLLVVGNKVIIFDHSDAIAWIEKAQLDQLLKRVLLRFVEMLFLWHQSEDGEFGTFDKILAPLIKTHLCDMEEVIAVSLMILASDADILIRFFSSRSPRRWFSRS
ncbi:hypothetical protein BGX29_002370 [Mortierella sp. GBA35]|nr:hypothetical protein BGX29_002370 [Mortierella sp. GBA35]